MLLSSCALETERVSTGPFPPRKGVIRPGSLASDVAWSVLLEVLGRYVIFRKLPSADLGNIRLGRIFNRLDQGCF
jgi:hypothetical protein